MAATAERGTPISFNEAGSVRSRKLDSSTRVLSSSKSFNEAGSVRSRKPGCAPGTWLWTAAGFNEAGSVRSRKLRTARNAPNGPT